MTGNYVPQIVDSFKASVLERILVVDDAYDAPQLEEDRAGGLLDVLRGPDLRNDLSKELFSEDDRLAAIKSLEANSLDDETVAEAMSSLYSIYVKKRSPNVDPGGGFEAIKGAALEALDPLIELLEQCTGEVNVQRVGKDGALSAYQSLKPDLILMDFYLSPPERTARAVTGGESNADRERSIDVLKNMLSEDDENTPAVVLMSAAEVGDRTAAYRGSLQGRVTSLRFGFLNKNWIDGAGVDLNASGEAADVLMETSVGFEFGRTLESALRQWRDGAKAGSAKLYNELSEFDVKDFAYLLRFRLYQEGEPFADYLEWFFGESLRAIVDDEVKWNAEAFSRLNEPKLTEAIEGAHPIPSDQLAKFFHRMRFNSRENRQRRRYGLGDLFVAENSQDVRMVITPDCDLILRGKSTRASRVLTIGGKIWGLEADQALAGELIFHGSPKSIRWNYKDVETHKFNDITILHVGETQYDYFGTLRPMSAQVVQRAALEDLSRVGLPVAPPVDVGAPVRVFVRKKRCNRVRMEEMKGLGEARAQVVMPRGGGDSYKRALFTPKFVRELVASVEKIDPDELLEEQRSHRTNWIGDLVKVRKGMLREGLKLPGEAPFKVGVCVGSHSGKCWLQIVVDVSDEALIRLSGTDPFAD